MYPNYKASEDAFIAAREKDAGKKLPWFAELGMRFAFQSAAMEFYPLGLAHGRRGQQERVKDVMGIREGGDQ